MSSTAKNVFEETVKSTVDTFCSTYSNHLSAWLAENKSVECTPEELCEAFNVAFKAPSNRGVPSGATVQTQMPNLPNYYAGTGVTTPKKRGGRTKKAVDMSLPQCEYKMSRGKSAGKRCENRVLGDDTLGADRYCKTCLGKKAVKNVLEQDETKSTVQPPVLPGSVVNVPENEEDKNDELSVVAIPDRDGYFRETKYGFIVQQQEDGTVFSGAIDDNGTERELTDDEKKIATSLGIQIVSSDPAPEVPQVPQV